MTGEPTHPAAHCNSVSPQPRKPTPTEPKPCRFWVRTRADPYWSGADRARQKWRRTLACPDQSHGSPSVTRSSLNISIELTGGVCTVGVPRPIRHVSGHLESIRTDRSAVYTKTDPADPVHCKQRAAGTLVQLTPQKPDSGRNSQLRGWRYPSPQRGDQPAASGDGEVGPQLFR